MRRSLEHLSPKISGNLWHILTFQNIDIFIGKELHPAIFSWLDVEYTRSH
jgi:hypothetical protein